MLRTAFFLFFISLATFPSTLKSSDSIIVQVKYPRQPISRTEGQPLTLRCTAEYTEEFCGNISVGWCLSVSEDLLQRLTDPDKYLIQVNETKINSEFRHREASVTFQQLSSHDTGLYQCKAVCQRTRATAMGHLISVNVTGEKMMTDIPGDTKKSHVIPNLSDRRSMDVLLLTNSIFLLLWIQASSAC